ncbi:MAG: phosphatidylglycerophosphatase A [Chromatiales bacterium]|jgi:phosphatidylglycerophosphatase A|nr:phosphatidylglycerophosphatase A [Chromatiales bacterium]
MNDKQPENLVSTVMRDPVHLLAFGLGAGLLPIAPGTWGSLFTALVFWFFAPVDLFILLGISTVLFVLGIWICGTSSRRLGVHDHGGIVLDEVVGMLLTLTVVNPEPLWILAAFFAFRLFDIWKPWPIRDVDHSLTGGLGIMLDDVLAAIYSVLAIFVLQRFITGS